MDEEKPELAVSSPPKSRRGRSKKSEIAATQEVEELLDLPVLEEEPKKGRKGK